MADDRRQLPSQPLHQLQPHLPQPQQQQQKQPQQQNQQQQQQQQQQQAALSSARLQHFNYLTPASSQVSVQASVQAPPQQQQQQQYLGLSAPERRHYSFDTDRDSRRFSMSTTLNMDYDQTEGLGGLSVSSYESIDDDRSEPGIRGYHFSSKSIHFYLYYYCILSCMYFFCPSMLDSATIFLYHMLFPILNFPLGCEISRLYSFCAPSAWPPLAVSWGPVVQCNFAVFLMTPLSNK
jgi:hypothetical protein